jgi:hypothetical protein
VDMGYQANVLETSCGKHCCCRCEYEHLNNAGG